MQDQTSSQNRFKQHMSQMEHTKPPKALHRRHEMLLYIYLAKISYSTSSHFKGEEIEMSLAKNDDRSNTGQNMKESELSR